jgi:hypothetical protein
MEILLVLLILALIVAGGFVLRLIGLAIRLVVTIVMAAAVVLPVPALGVLA